MPLHEITLQAFVSSPSDVSEERAMLEDIVRELNLTWSKSLGMRIELIKWETHVTPGMGQNPQQVINTQIGDFNTNAKGEIENALVIVKAMLAGLLQMEQTNFDFKQTIASWPRVTSAINKARRHTVAVLEQLAVEVKTSINLLSEVKRLMSDLLEKNQGPLEAKPYRVL